MSGILSVYPVVADDQRLSCRKFIGYNYGQTLSSYDGLAHDYMENGNASCPWANISRHCLSSWTNTTDLVTGKAQGRGNVADYYDPRWRPWYKKNKEFGQAVWSDVYLFAAADTGLGITATVPIKLPNGRQIGVVGIDCTYPTCSSRASFTFLSFTRFQISSVHLSGFYSAQFAITTISRRLLLTRTIHSF